MRGELQRSGLGEIDDAGLGCCIGGVTGCGPDSFDRRDVDDGAPDARVHHPTGHLFGADQDLPQVRAVKCVEPAHTCLQQRREEGPTSIVDQDVDAAEPVQGRGDRLIDRVVFAYVHRDGQSSDVSRGYSGSGRVTLPDRDVGAERVQALGDAPADSSATPGHDRHRAIEAGGIS